MSYYELEELKQANQLMREGKINEALQIVLELEKRSDLSSKDLLSCIILKANFFRKSGEFSEALKYANQVLDESQKQGDNLSYLDGLLIQAHSFSLIGDLNKGMKILEQAEELFKNLKGVLKIDLRERESFMVRIKAVNVGFRGDIQLCLKLNERALELSIESNDKELIANSLTNIAEDYQFFGDYDKAIIFAKRAIEVRYPPILLFSLGVLIDNLLAKGDVINAKIYFQHMNEVIEKDESNFRPFLIPYYEALILKTSLRARDRIKAEDLFKQIVENKESFEFTLKALINLCSLLLTELIMTNDLGVINEIEPYITTLLNMIEQQQVYWFAAETYLLYGKFNLLTFNMKKAKRFLTQAQQIAERYGPPQFSIKIAKEKDDLLKNEDQWNKLMEEDAPIIDRVSLAHLHEQIEGMVRNPAISTAFIREEKVAITKETKICMVCRGEVFKFTYICECGAIYCENCARALTNLENVCWSCERPIDTSKPIKLHKEEEGIISENSAKKDEKMKYNKT